MPGAAKIERWAVSGCETAGWHGSSIKRRGRFDQEWWVNRVRREFGKTYPEQMLEIRRLTNNLRRLQMEEYYEYGLYDPARNADAQRGKYVGRASWPKISLRFNQPQAIASMPDRFELLKLLARWDVPVPGSLAIFNRSDGSLLHDQIIDGPGLHRFLRSPEGTPSVGKPMNWRVRAGASVIAGYDTDHDCLILEGRKRVPATAFLSAVQRSGHRGYMFEEYLKPHQGLTEQLGARLATVRMTILRSSKDAVVFRPVLKIPGVGVDGQSAQAGGDFIAGINSKTGEVLPAIRRRGPVHETVMRHPGTDALLTDITLPQWRDIIYMVKRAAGLFPGLHLQRWDVAFTDTGPVVLDVGGNVDFQMAQKAWGRGLLDGPLGLVVSRFSNLNG